MTTSVPLPITGSSTGERQLTLTRHPWRKAAEGASWAALISAMITTGLANLNQHLFPLNILTFALFALLTFLLFSLGEGVATLLRKIALFITTRLRVERARRWVEALPAPVIGRLVIAFLYVFGNVLFQDSFFKYVSCGAAEGLVICGATLSGALLGLLRKQAFSLPQHIVFDGLALLPLAAIVAWLWWPGSDAFLASPLPAAPVAPLAVAHPGLPGSFEFGTLTYGSGTDKREAYGSGADLITAPVDGSMIYPAPTGPLGAFMRWRWGFDQSHMPLNALVWYPEGAGPFPLVLIVHGNHAAFESSEPGYAYLGEHLATHGFIAVSIDENFVNGWVFSDGGGNEMPLRAWLVLKHLEQWRAWNTDPGNPLYGRVDLGQIALIGHSRGGEAVAHAASINRQVYRPIDQASSQEDFDFAIRALVSIAPSDGFYQPHGTRIRLSDVSYLSLAGAHDADAHIFWGLSQYERTTFTGSEPEAFKAIAYLYRANHGQFNSVWQYGDRGRAEWLLLNRAALLPLTEQQATARTTITAFLRASLRGEEAYRELFYRPDAAREWLPASEILVTQYQDASYLPVDRNQQAGRPERIEVEDGSATSEGLATWTTEQLVLRDGEYAQHNAALHLSWERGSEPALSYSWPIASSRAWSLTPRDSLTFKIGSGRDDYTPANLVIMVESGGGERAAVPLANWAAIQPPLVPHPYKSEGLARVFRINYKWPWQAERVLQVVDIPLAAFVEANPNLRVDQLTSIRIEVDGQEAGALYLDEVGFRRVSP